MGSSHTGAYKQWEACQTDIRLGEALNTGAIVLTCNRWGTHMRFAERSQRAIKRQTDWILFHKVLSCRNCNNNRKGKTVFPATVYHHLWHHHPNDGCTKLVQVPEKVINQMTYERVQPLVSKLDECGILTFVCLLFITWCLLWYWWGQMVTMVLGPMSMVNFLTMGSVTGSNLAQATIDSGNTRWGVNQATVVQLSMCSMV